MALAACSDSGVGPTPTGTGGLLVVARPPATDTVFARPAQALVVEVRDSTGQLLPGVTVRFTGLPDSSGTQPTMFVANLNSDRFNPFAADRTDARGRASVLVLLGFLAGPAKIEVTVPEFAYREEVAFVVQPGAVADVRLTPRDTALYQGERLDLRGFAIDQYGNRRTDPVTYQASSVPAGAGTVTGAQLTAAAPFGLVTVTGSVSGKRDSMRVSIIPKGTLIAYDFSDGHYVEIATNGSNRRTIGRVNIPGDEPALAPDRSEIALSDNGVVRFLGLDGRESELSFPGGFPAYWPAYSPDGVYVYFSGQSRGFNLWRVKRDGTGLEQITTGDFQVRPSLDPAGRFVAYHSAVANTVVVEVVDLATRQPLPNQVPGLFPEWSPVGDLIAFVDHDGTIKVMAPNGSGIRALTPAFRYQAQPLAWSPDGQWLVARSETLDLIHVATGIILPLSRPLTRVVWKSTP